MHVKLWYMHFTDSTCMFETRAMYITFWCMYIQYHDGISCFNVQYINVIANVYLINVNNSYMNTFVSVDV